MHETSKAISRRLSDSRFATRYFVGDGIDIGAGEDCLGQYQELFPAMRQCRGWDMEDGDAQYLASLPDNSFDFVHSSHCLEHMHDPLEALKNWLRVLKPGGHLIVLVPDEDLYEQGTFPSTFNADHKWTFTHCKPNSWSPRSINLTELISTLSDQAQLLKMELLDATFLYSLKQRTDQTKTPIGECASELIFRKLPEKAQQLPRGLSLSQSAANMLKNRPVFLMAPSSSIGMVFGPSIAASCNNLIAAIDDQNAAHQIHGAPRWTSTEFLEKAENYPDLLAIDLSVGPNARTWVARLCEKTGAEHCDWIFRSNTDDK